MIDGNEAARRCGVFLHVLARTGNITRAGAEAGSSHYWFRARRKKVARFARQWDEALATARETIGAEIAAGSAPAGRWLRRNISGQAQEARPRAGGWSAKKEAAFLDSLAKHCHIGRAARAAGVRHTTCYRRRRSHPDFARAWDEAIDDARAALSAKLMRQAVNGTRAGEGGERLIAEPDDDRAIEDTALALAMIKLREALAARRAREAATDEPPIEEVRASILAKIEAIEAAEAREKAP